MSHKLKPKQRKAATMLAVGHNATAIAGWLKLRRETLSRWKKIPEFQQEIERVTEAEREVVRHKLAHMTEAAVEALWSELYNSGSGSKRFQTALYVLQTVGNGQLALPDPPSPPSADAVL